MLLQWTDLSTLTITFSLELGDLEEVYITLHNTLTVAESVCQPSTSESCTWLLPALR